MLPLCSYTIAPASRSEQRRYFKPSGRDLQEQQETKSGNDPLSPSPEKQEQPKTRTTALLRAIKVPQYGPDAEKAVRSLQDARKERARAKTAANVRRALYGNLIICASKFGAWLSSGSSSMMSEFMYVLCKIVGRSFVCAYVVLSHLCFSFFLQTFCGRLWQSSSTADGVERF
jgi:hypothetical protein